MGQFVAALLGETEDRWKEIFESAGKTYQAPRLVMFSGVTRSACGAAQSAMGPFYCPNDQSVYLDTTFFRQIETRFRGCDVGSRACQFSQAYVIAHEIGHHVQNLLGILPKVQQMQANTSRAEANQVQVRVELQAIVSQAYGPIVRNRNGSSLSRATSTPRCKPRQQSATIHYKNGRKVTWCRTHSRTAPPSNASAGSRPGLIVAPWKAATHLARFERHGSRSS
jgi:hypothetical protein